MYSKEIRFFLKALMLINGPLVIQAATAVLLASTLLMSVLFFGY
jgi:hypothetical protein